MKQVSEKWKMDAKFRCFMCIHVKTGTLFYGIVSVLVHLLMLGLLFLAAIHPDVLINDTNQQPYDGIVVVETKNGNFFERMGGPNIKEQLNKDNLCMMFAVTLAWLMAEVCLLYGIARHHASYLMPCFCLQVFDFCLSCLGMVGCFTYAPNIKEWIRDQGLESYPVFDRLMCMDKDYLMFLFICALTVFLSIKAYLIGMVWACYQWIQLYVASRSVMREYFVDPDTQVLMPPRYEDAIKMPSNQPEPPAYQ